MEEEAAVHSSNNPHVSIMKRISKTVLIAASIAGVYFFLTGPFAYFNELGKYGTTQRPMVYLIYPAAFIFGTGPETPLSRWMSSWRTLAEQKRERGYRKARGDAIEHIMRAGAEPDMHDGSSQSTSSADSMNPTEFTTETDRIQRAADLGDPDAQAELGDMYRDGRGVRRSSAKAIYWLEKSANQGSPLGQVLLGLTHYYGDGVPRDKDAGLLLIRTAAESGDPGAEGALGLLYLIELVQPEYRAEAKTWLQKSSSAGNPVAGDWLAKRFRDPEPLTADEMRDWKKRHPGGLAVPKPANLSPGKDLFP